MAPQYNYLGVLLDECMTLTPNFDSIFKKFSYKIFQFGKSYKYMDTNTRFLVYKQTILPLVEYVSFMLCMNNVSEADMLQKLQNRCLRFCLEIGNPIELSVDRLHQIARVNKLDLRRDVQLLSLMFSLKMINMYRKDGVCVPHNIDRYTFYTEIVHKDVYAKSPYFKGVTLWNTLPANLQNKPNGHEFKICIKKTFEHYVTLTIYEHLIKPIGRC